MRVRGRAVIFVTFNAFAHMLNKCVFIAHSGVCHELNSLICVSGIQNCGVRRHCHEFPRTWFVACAVIAMSYPGVP